MRDRRAPPDDGLCGIFMGRKLPVCCLSLRLRLAANPPPLCKGSCQRSGLRERILHPRLLLEEKLSPQVTDEVYLAPPCKDTSSVTAYAVPPSPPGEGFGAAEICWIYSITSICATQEQSWQHTLPGLKLICGHPLLWLQLFCVPSHPSKAPSDEGLGRL